MVSIRILCPAGEDHEGTVCKHLSGTVGTHKGMIGPHKGTIGPHKGIIGPEYAMGNNYIKGHTRE